MIMITYICMTRRVWTLRQGRLRSIRGYPGAADTVRGSPTVLAGASYINLPKSNHHAGPDEKLNDMVITQKMLVLQRSSLVERVAGAYWVGRQAGSA